MDQPKSVFVGTLRPYCCMPKLCRRTLWGGRLSCYGAQSALPALSQAHQSDSDGNLYLRSHHSSVRINSAHVIMP